MNKKYTNILYYIAFTLTVLQKLVDNSTLIELSTVTNHIIILIISLLFTIKIIGKTNIDTF